MFVDLWQSTAKVEISVVKRMIERQFNPLLVGKNTLHFAPERFIQTVVIIGMQKAARVKMTTEIFNFTFTEADIAMARKIKIRVVKNFIILQRNPCLNSSQLNVSIFIDEY